MALHLVADDEHFDHNSGTHFRPVADSVRVLLFAGSSLTAFAVDTAGFAVLQGMTGWIAGSIVGARLLSAGVNFVLIVTDVPPLL